MYLLNVLLKHANRLANNSNECIPFFCFSLAMLIKKCRVKKRRSPKHERKWELWIDFVCYWCQSDVKTIWNWISCKSSDLFFRSSLLMLTVSIMYKLHWTCSTVVFWTNWQLRKRSKNNRKRFPVKKSPLAILHIQCVRKKRVWARRINIRTRQSAEINAHNLLISFKTFHLDFAIQRHSTAF